MKKNLLIMKRNICSTIFEILFPIILLLLCYVIRLAFQLRKYYFDKEENDITTYIKNTSSIYADGYTSPPLLGEDSNLGLSIIPALKICSIMNDKHEPRPIIASIGLPQSIKDKIKNQAGDYKDLIKFKEFNSIEEMEDRIKDKTYGKGDNEAICFGVRFKKDGHKYDYSLHYFESMFNQGVQDIPNMRNGIFDKFSTGPDLASYRKYQNSGYIYILKLINEYILAEETDTTGTSNEAKIDMAMIALPYENYRSDPFGSVIGYFIPFFMVIAYMCPLCLYVYRMVGEKENKSKEGMKIMGLNEGTYFLSYFIQYVIITFIDSVINTFFMSLLFTRIPFILLFVILFLWALDIFGLIFFFQSFIDKTRVAVILSLLIYFVMFFLSMACMDENSNKVLKIVLSIFPPVSLELGIVLIGKFQSHFKDFHLEDYTETYTNYSIFIMNIMQIVDFFLYLFLGYYLQNVIPHEFGIKRPLYFICTKEYWCSSKNKNNNRAKKEINLALNKVEMDLQSDEIKIKKEMSGDAVNKGRNVKLPEKTNDYEKSNPRKLPKYEKEENINNGGILLDENKNNKNFESEDLYKDRTKPDDCLIVSNIVKEFEDGKVAVDHVNIKFYKDEIFALLGHNGAGKTTLISMLTGLYEATEGNAFYEGYDILDSNNMDEFRTKLGICPQHDVLFGQLTIREHLEMFCIFKGYKSDNIDEEINKTLHDFELDNIQNVTAENLSAGQRRKLSIAISLIGGSKVIFLDEPSSGMDITSRRNLWDILKRQTEQKIIILTTHYMEEASVLGKRIGIINAGKMKCIGTPLFLIERFGKFMNLNIAKEEGADNDKIIDFIQKRAQNVEYEILSEEILFRIPKKSETSSNDDKLTLSENSSNRNIHINSSLDLTKFFDDLDKNLKNLGIKTYSASMPTLEDVFLNVAAEDAKIENKKLMEKLAANEAQNDKILFETNFMENFQEKSKFWNDLKACFHRRFILTSRDIKGFLMEILCPILLVLVGLVVSQVDIIGESDPQVLNLASIGNQKILYAKTGSSINFGNYDFSDRTNISYVEISSLTGNNEKEKIKSFVESFYAIAKDKEDSIDHTVDMTKEDYVAYFGGLLMLESSDPNHLRFVEVLNTRVTHAVPLFSLHFLTELIKAKTKYPNEFQVNFLNYPMPLTAELEESKDQTSNSLVIFFVAIAFSLIPANFVTIIVREKLNNSKHLMRVSGISITAYWIINYLYELVKYYFTCGICLLLLYAFDFYKEYLYIFYLIYGPAMVASTYILSFLFSTESGAQNGIILLNFLLGALGSTVILLLRAMDNVKSVAKIIQYIISLLPSFCFNFGYSMILNKYMILMIEYEDNWYFLPDSIILEKFNLLLGPIIYLAAEFVAYTIILTLIESFSYFSCKVSDSRLGTNINDSIVLREIDLANQESTQIGITDEDGKSNKKEYSVRIKNLNKIYYTGIFCNNSTEAIRNMSFCVEPGECFGLLGLNGAGKTTTFKCITQELSPTHGKIYINGKDMRNKFSELSSIFGYCPQFDAIFEYMSVYENLEFYGKIKGIKAEYLKQVVMAMIEEMSLGEFTYKIAGRLSGGNKRKLTVAISFLCSPPIVLLDEPSTGMDPEARRFMWSVIHKISTKGKKASVIMTTHSMDEAETLCKRMAIMVNGEFVCLGRAGQIKEKYGYGYEIEVRIKPLSEEKFERILKQKNLNKDLKITFQNINQILQDIDKPNFINELSKGRFGSKIIREIQINNDIPIRTLLSWIFFVENAIKFIKKAENYFENIILTEFIDNNFLFKMKKNQDTKSIGFFFGLFESNKNECFVTEYSIRQTSLEQIFNMFEDKQRKKNNKADEEKKEEIIIDKSVYNTLLK